jgi:hypothetical protein
MHANHFVSSQSFIVIPLTILFESRRTGTTFSLSQMSCSLASQSGLTSKSHGLRPFQIQSPPPHSFNSRPGPPFPRIVHISTCVPLGRGIQRALSSPPAKQDLPSANVWQLQVQASALSQRPKKTVGPFVAPIHLILRSRFVRGRRHTRVAASPADWLCGRREIRGGWMPEKERASITILGKTLIWNSVHAVKGEERNELSFSGYKRFRRRLAFECSASCPAHSLGMECREHFPNGFKMLPRIDNMPHLPSFFSSFSRFQIVVRGVGC